MVKGIRRFLNRHHCLKAKLKVFFFVFRNPFGKHGYRRILKGKCVICDHDTTFWDFGEKSETFICFHCGSSARNRAVAKILLQGTHIQTPAPRLCEFNKDNLLRGYIASGYGMLAKVLSQRNFIISEYFDGVPFGSFKEGIRCEDLTQLTFQGEVFDIVISEHVLEHVPDPFRAFSEVNRVLKKSGLYIFTIPFEAQDKSVTRVLPDGTALLPELFHIDPLRHAGALVYTQFSKKDLIEKFLKPNMFEAEIIVVNDTMAGIFNCEVIKARKV